MKFVQRLKNTLGDWEGRPTVMKEEIYQFLHSIKGTAASIGLPELTNVAETLLNHLVVLTKQIWEVREWQALIEPVSEYIRTYEDVLTPEIQTPLRNQLPDQPLILVIEDEVQMLALLKEELENEQYAVLLATNVEKAVEIFYSQKPDYVLLDMYLESESGFEVLEQIVEKAKQLLIPIMVISADDSKYMRMNVYRAGGFDFFPKPIEVDELKVLLKARLEHRKLLTRQILLDELTGAYNRKFLHDELERQVAEYERNNIDFSLAILDIDKFKSVNDTYGHDVGDNVLSTFSSLVLTYKRKGDFFIRYGGEEFMVLMPQTKVEEGKWGISRLLNVFQQEVFHGATEDFSCTFSSGVVSYRNHESVESMIKRADQLLYEAKSNGRNQIRTEEDLPLVIDHTIDQTLRIGIIDDDPVIHDVLRDHLQNVQFDGYKTEVKSFLGGASFFDSNWHKQGGKFVLLLDGVMPDMDGLDVLERMRNECDVKDFVIIMLTGRKEDKDIVRALELGADDYLTKPFNIHELEIRVKRLADRMLMLT